MTPPTGEARHPYETLTPDAVLDALDSVGLVGDGRLMALSSYENRVYQVHLEDPVDGHSAVVVKFYRPGRWSTAQILEEHAFAAELMAAEVPAVGPLALHGQTLHQRIVTKEVFDEASWTTLKCWNGSAAFWPASTPWAPAGRLSTGVRWTSPPLRRSPWTGCWRTR